MVVGMTREATDEMRGINKKMWSTNLRRESTNDVHESRD